MWTVEASFLSGSLFSLRPTFVGLFACLDFSPCPLFPFSPFLGCFLSIKFGRVYHLAHDFNCTSLWSTASCDLHHCWKKLPDLYVRIPFVEHGTNLVTLIQASGGEGRDQMESELDLLFHTCARRSLHIDLFWEKVIWMLWASKNIISPFSFNKWSCRQLGKWLIC
jgi:hypothetical protein